MDAERLTAALGAWRAALGDEAVHTDAAATAAAGIATFDTTQTIPAILYPASVDQVRECLRIANRYRAPLYPISTGKNWGLGSRVPPRDGCAVLDLSRLNRILDFDEKLACVTVEPGVTFHQLHRFLADRKSALFAAVTGGSPYGSVLANALERGDGEGPCGDRAAHVAGLEVVLPNGEVIHTGFARFDGNRSAKTNRWGVGPALDGLFMQSNLGVVTRMTVWLSPKPAYQLCFTCKIADGAIGTFVDALRPLVLHELIRGNCITLWNSYKFLARAGRYPWSLTQGKTPFSLREVKGAEPWFAAGSVYCASREAGTAAQTVIAQALGGRTSELNFIDTASLTPELLAMLEPGVPREQNLRTTYWRKRCEIPDDPDPQRDRCGVIWLCPVLPFDGASLLEVAGIVEGIVRKHALEPQIGFNPTSGRNLNMYITLVYDRDVAGEDARAMACHDELLQALATRGVLPYRLGIQSMDKLPPTDDGYTALLRILKQTLDPNDILAPGRYDFRESPETK
jgi:FAD/FMN-containing dehydrogenase